MENLTGNTNSEMLHLYVDGELETSLEPGLFDELSVNENLRTEMRELMAIRNTVQSDSESFAPPLAAAGSVFNRVGLMPPIILPPPAALQPAAVTGAVWLTLMRNLWAPAIVALVSIIGTGLILNNYYNNKIDQLKASLPKTSSTEPQVKSNSNLNSTNFTEFKHESAKTRTIIKYVNTINTAPYCIDENNAESYKNIPVANAPVLAEYSLNKSNPYKSEIQSTSTYNINASLLTPDVNNEKLMSLIRKTDSKYSLYIRGMSSKSYPDAEMPVGSDPLFANMSIGTYIHNNKNMQFGIELGQESYSQVYNNTENGENYQYMQKPVVFWGALGAMLISNRLDFLAGAQPYAHLMIGGSQLGPIGKGILGFQINSADLGFGILLGIEGSVLYYQNQKIWYSTRKLGFTFGTTIHF